MSRSSDSDASPPRRPRGRTEDVASDSDASPPRRPGRAASSINVDPLSQRRPVEQVATEAAKLTEKLRERRDDSEFRGEERVKMSRYRDDEELNDSLRKRARWGDPMERLIEKKPRKRSPQRVYRGPPAPPNRFNIPPGPRWDGVDRSIGFESRLFEMRAERRLAEDREDVMNMRGL